MLATCKLKHTRTTRSGILVSLRCAHDLFHEIQIDSQVKTFNAFAWRISMNFKKSVAMLVVTMKSH